MIQGPFVGNNLYREKSMIWMSDYVQPHNVDILLIFPWKYLSWCSLETSQISIDLEHFHSVCSDPSSATPGMTHFSLYLVDSWKLHSWMQWVPYGMGHALSYQRWQRTWMHFFKTKLYFLSQNTNLFNHKNTHFVNNVIFAFYNQFFVLGQTETQFLYKSVYWQ